ncbi:lysis system i-spanin subunit Rz [Stenotrophomonas maltophilia]|uniref:lysis system i-spanin subunit Rz n=1 Tax=Stenotrophomonas maltophilia TaxID=40324 RepID=UPI0013D9B3EC|nr:lysis system i-spanin subunit Rz [Stenotrophomonas maltophilia]
MPRMLMMVASLLLWSLLMFVAGWRWRGDRSDLAMARADAARHAGAVQSEQRLRREQEERSEAMASLGEQHEHDRERAAAVDADVVAALRAGTLRLRDDLAACHTGRLSEAAARSGERDAGAQLRAEVAAALVRIGRDADDQLRACQTVIELDRR